MLEIQVNLLPSEQVPNRGSNAESSRSRRHGQGESETLRFVSQTHLQPPSSDESHRYGPYKTSAQPQILHHFPNFHHPNYRVRISLLVLYKLASLFLFRFLQLEF